MNTCERPIIPYDAAPVLVMSLHALYHHVSLLQAPWILRTLDSVWVLHWFYTLVRLQQHRHPTTRHQVRSQMSRGELTLFHDCPQ